MERLKKIMRKEKRGNSKEGKLRTGRKLRERMKSKKEGMKRRQERTEETKEDEEKKAEKVNG